ncbi:hypothetical protein IIE18_10825 [Pseudomonas sp. V1]|uniref:hypothetical protein n=1 Tax=Pseudomonas arcuscaelestis TaxID=2710591 RepID=UPI00193FEE60|nr:hypothetical protein [Pseudomonas arcuscaelestis]MBM3105634.1 hypothetical protein [Pseudomonas arcuscaelestis]
MTTPSSTLSERIDRHLESLRSIAHGHRSGRFLSFVDVPNTQDEESPEGPDHILRILFSDVGNEVGEDFISTVDSVALEQFCLMSVIRNEGTGGMLRSLITSFMAAYANPATSDDAIAMLKRLEDLSSIPAPASN